MHESGFAALEPIQGLEPSSILYGLTPPRASEVKVLFTEDGVEEVYDEKDVLVKVIIPQGVCYREIKHANQNSSARIIYVNAEKQIHRDDGPAVEYESGTKCWYQNDKQHRDNAPCVINVNGFMCWKQHGEFHREDGPAVVWQNGEISWYLHGIEYATEEERRQAKASN